ncbi:MAG: tetraacyldisaccharide 4'-kinase [Deltaproteobacteria bacterium]|nr:tetraacyldisaccharide 4'-kinase [Deltaproteobacteria bacterium]
MHLIKYIDGTYNSFLAKIFLFPLYIISLIYGLIIRIRFFFYTTGTFKTRQLPYPVISVGNITVGGSGKTPMTIYLARRLTEKGKKVTVISRGYKGKNKGVGIVSDGQNIFMNPEEAGDEPFLIASKVKDCPVIIGKDRYKAGLLAVKRFKPDLIILDDGFQQFSPVYPRRWVSALETVQGPGHCAY